MATFTEMQTEVNLLLIDTPTAIQQLVPTFINRAIRSLQKKHNFKVMEQSVSFTTTADTRELGAIPELWKAPRGKPFLTWDTGKVREINWATLEINAAGATGMSTDYDYGAPRFIRLGATQFEVYPFSDTLSDYDDGEYRVTLPYWGYTAALSGSQTNWFSINAEEAIIFRAVADGFYAIEDEGRAGVWEKRAFDARREAINTDKYTRVEETQVMPHHLGARIPHTQE